MHQKNQQLEVLMDLLAQETQKYTKAYISGNLKETAEHKAIIDLLIAEINLRKKSVFSDNVDGKLLSD